MKLIFNVMHVGHKCKLCEKIDSKMKRRAVEVDRVSRWQRESSKFRVSIDKAMENIRALDGEIYELSCERNRRLQGIGTPSIREQANPTKSESIGVNQREGIILQDNRDGLPNHRKPPDLPPNVGVLSSPNNHHRQHGTEVAKDYQEEGKTIRYRNVQKKNILFGLPITFESVCNPATVMAVPDTGADENIISLDLALDLGLEIDFDEKYKTNFEMINKTFTRCCGFARALCGFGTTSHLGPNGLACDFRVSETTVSPLIMSCNFLMATHTLSRYRHRLVSLSKSMRRLPCIRSLGQSTQRLMCSIDGEDAQAFPDSGSDVDVISHNYALQRNFTIVPTNARIMLADGSIEHALGLCIRKLAVGSGFRMNEEVEHPSLRKNQLESRSVNQMELDLSPVPVNDSLSTPETQKYRNVITTTFYVLRDISIDVLLGGASLESLQVYTHHQDQFVTTSSRDTSNSSLHRIVLLGKMGKILRRAAVNAFGKGHDIASTSDQTLCEADQRENSRREAARREASRMTGVQKSEFEEHEGKKQAEYDEYRAWLQEAISQESLRKRTKVNGT